MRAHKRRYESGETLTETLAAILIVTLSSLVLATAVMTSVRINRSAVKMDDALEMEKQTAEVQINGRNTEVTLSVNGVEKDQYPVEYYGGGGALASYVYRGDSE